MGARALTTIAALGAVAMLIGAPVQAQRRDQGPATGVFRVTLASPVRFGDVVVPARKYRLTLSDAGFALADADSMVLVATVPVEESTGHVSVTPATVEVSQNGQTVTIVMQYADHVYKAAGSAVELTLPSSSRVILAGKTERLVEGMPSHAEATDVENVTRALMRYRRSLQHCADAAHRSRWRTDDPRFVRCVCPIIERWRLPRVSAPLRMHHPLAKGRSGFSFTVTTEGKAVSCRVWVGASPPVDKTREPVDTSDAAPEVNVEPTPTTAGNESPAAPGSSENVPDQAP